MKKLFEKIEEVLEEIYTLEHNVAWHFNIHKEERGTLFKQGSSCSYNESLDFVSWKKISLKKYRRNNFRNSEDFFMLHSL